MIVTAIERKFIFKDGNNSTIDLDEINESMTPEQVMEHYAQLYPQLTNANIVDKGIVNGFHEIQFNSLAGTKG